jgi:hypothetical protein
MIYSLTSFLEGRWKYETHIQVSMGIVKQVKKRKENKNMCAFFRRTPVKTL